MKIERSVIWNNRTGENTSWFHPRCCRLGNGQLFMSMQSIGGSDFYGAVHESIFDGKNWSIPVGIPDLDWKPSVEDISEGVCDVVPYYHAPTDTVLAIGHNVYYKDGALFDSVGDWEERKGPTVFRFPVWAVRNSKGEWVRSRQMLEIPELTGKANYSCGSSQWFFRGTNDVYIPIAFACFGRRDRVVFSTRFHYDGENMKFVERGNILELPNDRGLLEPSLVDMGSRILLTLRAEDGCGYVTESTDGLNWAPIKPWKFDDGETLEMSSTQQHFLFCGGKLHLVYTRGTGYNSHVTRFRAPLFIAEVTDDLTLVKASEEIVFPLLEEGVFPCDNKPHAPGMGNFQAIAISDNEAIISVGEERWYDNYLGNTLLARLTF